MTILITTQAASAGIPSGLYEGFTASDTSSQDRITVITKDRCSSIDDSTAGFYVRYCDKMHLWVATAWGVDHCSTFLLPASFLTPYACFGPNTMFPDFSGITSLDDDVSVTRFSRTINATGAMYEVALGSASCMPYYSVGGSQAIGYSFATIYSNGTATAPEDTSVFDLPARCSLEQSARCPVSFSTHAHAGVFVMP